LSTATHSPGTPIRLVSAERHHHHRRMRSGHRSLRSGRVRAPGRRRTDVALPDSGRSRACARTARPTLRWGSSCDLERPGRRYCPPLSRRGLRLRRPRRPEQRGAGRSVTQRWQRRRSQPPPGPRAGSSHPCLEGTARLALQSKGAGGAHVAGRRSLRTVDRRTMFRQPARPPRPTSPRLYDKLAPPTGPMPS